MTLPGQQNLKRLREELSGPPTLHSTHPQSNLRGRTTDRLTADHDRIRNRPTAGFWGGAIEVRHPESGRKPLFLNRTAVRWIDGLPRGEGIALAEFLTATDVSPTARSLHNTGTPTAPKAATRGLRPATQTNEGARFEP